MTATITGTTATSFECLPRARFMPLAQQLVNQCEALLLLFSVKET